MVRMKRRTVKHAGACVDAFPAAALRCCVVETQARLCRCWLVQGRVQGVGFRWFVLHRARPLGLAGTVRNLTDGRVEVVARGMESDLMQLEACLRRGPAAARVTDVATTEATLDVDIHDFRIAI